MRLGRYELLHKLGEGGMAEVFLARYSAAAGAVRQVVVKRILPAVVSDEHSRNLFVSEARLSMQLSHGNLVQVFDFGEDDGQYYLAMEYVDGLSADFVLEHARQKGLPGIPVPIAVAIVIDVARGLHFAHTRVDEQGRPLHIIHRDVSPENVLISYEGAVKLGDFGVARARLEGRQFTAPGTFKGKPDFAAPEQARAEVQTARVDVYAAGLMLLELITGENPQHGHLLEIAAGTLRLRAQSPLIDRTLAAIIDDALEPNPDQRLLNALQLQERLTAWLAANAPIALAAGVQSFMAWLEPKALMDRGLSASVPSAFTEWLAAWTRRHGTNPSQPAVRAVTESQFPEAPTLLHEVPVQEEARTAAESLPEVSAQEPVSGRTLALGLVVALVVVGLVVLVLERPGPEPLVVTPEAPTEAKARPAPPAPPAAPFVAPPVPTRLVDTYPAVVELSGDAHGLDVTRPGGGVRLDTLLDAALERERLLLRRRGGELAPKPWVMSEGPAGPLLVEVGSAWTPVSFRSTVFLFEPQARAVEGLVELELARQSPEGPRLHSTLRSSGADLALLVEDTHRLELRSLNPDVPTRVTLRAKGGAPVVVLVDAQRTGAAEPVRLLPGRPVALRGTHFAWLVVLRGVEPVEDLSVEVGPMVP